MLRSVIPILALILAMGSVRPGMAGTIEFVGWTEQRFSLFSSVDYSQRGRTVDIASDGAASLIWRQLPQADWDAGAAGWVWSVTQSVPPTDLTRKGGDDRNAAVYFVFLPRNVAKANAGSASIRKLLARKDARVLVYVWGGAHRRGQVLESPYLGTRGRTIILRGSGTGEHQERVNLSGDYARIFGGTPGALVGIAVSADSDDTDTVLAAEIGNLVLQ